MSNTGWIDFKKDLTYEVGVGSMLDTLFSPIHGESKNWRSKKAVLGQKITRFSEGGLTVEEGQNGKNIALMYEGSVDNLIELREDLRNLGFEPTSESGSSLLILAYKCWGKEFVKHLFGSFCVTLWDEEKERLLLCRDRIGVKPLYYAPLASGILFGSLPKSIFANSYFTPEFEVSVSPL